MTPVNLTLRLTAIVLFSSLLTIGVSMALGAPLSQGILTFTNNITDMVSDIYVLDVARGITYNLTRTLELESYPAWASDGSQLAFTSAVDARLGDRALFVMDASGRNRRRMTDVDTGISAAAPAWSPDGRFLAYVIRIGPWLYIDIVDLLADVHYVVTDTSMETLSPVWSPDSRWLAFQGRQPATSPSSFPNTNSLYVLDMTRLEQPDAGLRHVMVLSHPFTGMAWSPDGRFIALNHIRDEAENANWDIGIVGVASGEMVFETTHAAADIQPAWSPDSTQLAFRSTRDGDADIYIVEVNTGEIRQFTNDSGDESFPVWSPDGREIIYLSEQPTGYVFYMMDSSGGTPRYLAPGYWTSALVWQPDPRAVRGALP